VLVIITKFEELADEPHGMGEFGRALGSAMIEYNEGRNDPESKESPIKNDHRL
jgi:hypothetical protein